MRTPSDKKKLQCNSLDDTRRALKLETQRLTLEEKLKRGGNDLWPADVMNGVMTWFFTRPSARRKEIAEEGIAIWDRVRASDDMVKLEEWVVSDQPSAPAQTRGGGGHTQTLGEQELVSRDKPVGETDHRPVRRARTRKV